MYFVYCLFVICSMPDLSIPEIVRQFNERQSQMNKPKRRPHSSSVYTMKSSTRKNNSNDGKPSHNYNTFITGTQKYCYAIFTMHSRCKQGWGKGESEGKFPHFPLTVSPYPVLILCVTLCCIYTYSRKQ